MLITNKQFPLCSKLGVLRNTSKGNGRLVISTAALCELLGWKVYRKFLPIMQHTGTKTNPGCVTPESCEAFLRTLNGKVKKLRP